MGETLSLFRSSFNKSLRIESRPERLTGEPGAVLLREIMERTRIIGWLSERLHDPRKGDRVTYPLADLLRTVLLLLGQGWRDQDDADALRYDAGLPRLRAGNAHTAEGALEFILDLVDRVEEALCQVAVARIDAGFLDEKLLSGLERRGTRGVKKLQPTE